MVAVIALVMSPAVFAKSESLSGSSSVDVIAKTMTGKVIGDAVVRVNDNQVQSRHGVLVKPGDSVCALSPTFGYGCSTIKPDDLKSDNIVVIIKQVGAVLNAKIKHG